MKLLEYGIQSDAALGAVIRVVLKYAKEFDATMVVVPGESRSFLPTGRLVGRILTIGHLFFFAKLARRK